MPRWITISFTAALIALMFTGCISTNVKGFTDNEYTDFKIKKVAVRVPNASFAFTESIENSMVEKLAALGVEATSFIAMFPPTKDWTNGQVAGILADDGYDSIMLINLVNSGGSTETIGYINSGSGYTYGNSISYSGSSVPVRGVRRFTNTRVRLYEIHTADVIWIADASTQSGGLAFVGDGMQSLSISDEIASALVKSGHIASQ